ncbi:hypothetical protein [Miltoncostaea oceani]|uniref:hypothetical protein n=1 Tax=Miltoncostaea oceani TaxID=2843216 RepID=UPI001C3CDFED|nr:hypothetical protein [Miltoncostaea oceani]
MAAAGCGGGGASLAPSTAPLTDGTEVSPQRYLADTAAAAAAVNAFSDALSDVGATARPATLRRVARELQEPFDTTVAISERLAAARLQDRRLEAQRGRAAPLLADVVDAMTLVVNAAEAGDPEAAEVASTEFSTAIGELRKLPAAS